MADHQTVECNNNLPRPPPCERAIRVQVAQQKMHPRVLDMMATAQESFIKYHQFSTHLSYLQQHSASAHFHKDNQRGESHLDLFRDRLRYESDLAISTLLRHNNSEHDSDLPVSDHVHQLASIFINEVLALSEMDLWDREPRYLEREYSKRRFNVYKNEAQWASHEFNSTLLPGHPLYRYCSEVHTALNIAVTAQQAVLFRSELIGLASSVVNDD